MGWDALCLAEEGPAAEAVGADVLGEEPIDNLLEPSLLFNTVFILDTYLLNPFFSTGVGGPSFAGILIAAVVELY
jgi:hypothetical protein